jgi:hypothetical protein
MDKSKCKHCNSEFTPTKKYKDSEYCGICRKYHKNCKICGKEIFVQAKTCSKKCAYELRKLAWKESCGTEHNFSKDSKSRKIWETKLLENEGISNVFQREEVKEKCKISHMINLGVNHPSKSEAIKAQKKLTCMKNYGVVSGFCLTEKINKTMLQRYGKLRISNGTKISEIRKSKEFRQSMETKGLWIPLDSLNEWEIYSYNVCQITKEQIKRYFPKNFKAENKNKILKKHFLKHQKIS